MISTEELYHRYAQDVFRFAFWLCGERSEAEDLTSETFVRAWTHDSPLRLATVKGFLFAITRNLFLHERRRAGRRGDEPNQDLPDRAPGPARSAEARDELERVLAAMAKLPEADRAALLMRAEHGMAYAEIARVIGISTAAARVKVHRARLRLADQCGRNKGATEEEKHHERHP